jgi:hypothetical protein
VILLDPEQAFYERDEEGRRSAGGKGILASVGSADGDVKVDAGLWMGKTRSGWLLKTVIQSILISYLARTVMRDRIKGNTY